jgi:hypothetical protein
VKDSLTEVAYRDNVDLVELVDFMDIGDIGLLVGLIARSRKTLSGISMCAMI